MTADDVTSRVEAHLTMVKIIALKMAARLPRGIDLEDLVHAGVLGLIEASRRFDPTVGVKFATFASSRVRGAILDELRHLDWASRSMRQKIKDVEGAYGNLERQLGRPPSEEEVAAELKMDLTDFSRLLDDAKGMGSGVYRYARLDDAALGDEQLLTYSSDEESQSPVLIMEREQMKTRLAEMIRALPEREKLVLSLYYNDDLNLKEIAAVLDLTESRISQIRTSAILRLRARIAEMARLSGVSDREVL
jgi:RNA polymerase sigma factor FliA